MKKLLPIVLSALIICIETIAINTSFAEQATNKTQEQATPNYTAVINTVVGSLIGFILGGVVGTWLKIGWEHKSLIDRTLMDDFDTNANKFYLPICGSSSEAAESLEKFLENQENKEEIGREAFYDLSIFLSRVYQFKYAETGGIFLKMHIAEEIVNFLQRKIYASLGFKSTGDITKISKIISPNTDYEEYTWKLVASQELRSIYEKFTRWVGSASEDKRKQVRDLIKYLQYHSNIWAYEINRIYAPWYKDKPVLGLSREQVCELREILLELKSERNLPSFQILSYFIGLQRGR